MGTDQLEGERGNWDGFAPGKFRLPGYGGVAMFLRSHIAPARSSAEDGPSLVFDVGLLSPQRFTQYLARSADSEFVDRLAHFLFSAAFDFHPENSLETFTDQAMGLTVATLSSTDDRVEIEVTIIPELTAQVLDRETLNFETSRAVLVTAAQELRDLDGSWNHGNMAEGL